MSAVKQDHGQSRGGWHGATRKSRKTRLPISGTLGGPAEGTPTDSDWGHLEKAYGGEKISDDLRVEIKDAVEQYLYWAPFENSAIPVKDFAEQIKEARILAKELQKVVASFGSAATLVQRRWERRFHRDESESAHETPETPIEEDELAIFESAWDTERTQHRFFCNFRDVVRAVISVLDDTRREVMGEGLPGFSEGDAWNRLIVNLARGFRSKNLKATATKDLNRPPSAFVTFVKKLQLMFKEEFRRHNSTYAALSQAISQALPRSTLAYIAMVDRNKQPPSRSPLADGGPPDAKQPGEFVTYMPGHGDPATVKWRRYIFEANKPKRIRDPAHIEAARGNRFFRVGNETTTANPNEPSKPAEKNRAHIDKRGKERTSKTK